MNLRERRIAQLLQEREGETKEAFSKKYPIILPIIIFLRRAQRKLQNLITPKNRLKKSDEFFSCVIARHQSVLRRKLGSSDPRLQEQKITNLKKAVERLNGIIIEPGQTFSFWKNVGEPKYRKGFVDGMLLSGGEVIEGVGGGLCQLSNFLYWAFLHAPTKIVERHHHSKDVFPDSGRTLPFGSGATVFFNYVDLQVKNIGAHPLQLKLWLTDTHLKGQLVSTHHAEAKYHVVEKDHCFVKRGDEYYRYNVLYREARVDGSVKATEMIVENFAPVLYKVTPGYIEKHEFDLIDFTGVDLKR